MKQMTPKLHNIDSEVWMRDGEPRKIRALVVAPHPDDDVIGMGGRIRDYAVRGLGVAVVYVTDGAGAPVKAVSRSGLKKARNREAKRGIKILGAHCGIFLNYESGKLRRKTGMLVRDLGNIIAFYKPAEIFCPSPFEAHRTHLKCTEAAVEAARASGLKVRLLGYEVWTPIIAKPVPYDVSGVIESKRKAIMAHRSQTRANRFDEGMAGKNRYNAVFRNAHDFSKIEFAELFIDMTEIVKNKNLSLKRFALSCLAEFAKGIHG